MAQDLNDGFFDDEEERALEGAKKAQDKKPVKQKARTQAKTQKQEVVQAAPQQPLPMRSVLLIAAAALICGICIGYAIAMGVVGTQKTAANTTTVSSSNKTTESTTLVAELPESYGTSGSETSGTLPEGHPDLSMFYNEDGTLNQELVDEYMAAHSAS
ncbi:MAG: hypothetical protein IKE43_00295 [Coriobacteriales bacterium]|nr:hypothetical protein [Coriobacteriales bacterium]